MRQDLRPYTVAGVGPVALSANQLAALTVEMADVLIYLVRLADVVGVDLLWAARRKVADNEHRCPPNG